MANRSMNVVGVIALLGMMAGGCASEETMRPITASSAPVASTDRNRIAVGSAEDSWATCLGRIPSDASKGQRMLAEESCTRDQAARR